MGGDLVTAIDGQPVGSFDGIPSYRLANTKVGQQVGLTILRQGQEQTVSLTLAAQPKLVDNR